MRFFALIAVLAVAGSAARAAAPETGATPEAAARAATLTANVKSFQLHLSYHGEQDKPYYDLLLGRLVGRQWEWSQQSAAAAEATRPADAGGAATRPAGKPMAFDTYEGYFVSNKFEPDAPASFVVPRDREAFDGVFVSAFVKRDTRHRLPADAFESKAVVAAIKSGKAVWTYRVESVTADAAGALIVRYTAASEPHPSAEFASPLIVSVPKGDYAAVRFVEDGKLVKEIKPDCAKAANATEAFLGPADRWSGCAVELGDVHALWGRGTAVHLRRSGEAVIRVVANRTEKRFDVTLSAEESSAIRKLCIDGDLLGAPVKDRTGVPDEGRAVIALTNAEGKRREVGKWANDKVESFDRVYDGLLGLRKKTEHLKPGYEGPYQPEWKPPPAFDVKCRKPDDAVRVSDVGGKTVFDVTSPSGIGGATVARTADRWPGEVVLRIHLKGLESLRMAGGDPALRVSVLSHGGSPNLLHLQRGDDREGPELAKGEAGWTEVRTLDARGQPADGLPGEGGWFELSVPKVVLSDENKTLTLDWIDFYR